MTDIIRELAYVMASGPERLSNNGAASLSGADLLAQ